MNRRSPAAGHPERRPDPRLHLEDRGAVGAAPPHALRRRGDPRRARRLLGRSSLHAPAEPDHRGPAQGVSGGRRPRSGRRRAAERAEEALRRPVLQHPAPRQARDQPQYAAPGGPEARRAAHRHLATRSSRTSAPRCCRAGASRWERIHELNPRLVYMSTSGFGHTGEWKGYRSYGPTAAAQSGLSLASGLPGKPPAGLGLLLPGRHGRLDGRPRAASWACSRRRRPARASTSTTR